MPTYFSPSGNPEVWEEKPDDYFTPEEWEAQHPPPEPEPPTPEEQLTAAERAVAAYLNRKVREEKGYDNVDALPKYAIQTENASYKAEAEVAVNWVTTCWEAWYALRAAVEAGEKPLPTSEEVIAELPPLVWPE
jgi:hypothetical protein